MELASNFSVCLKSEYLEIAIDAIKPLVLINDIAVVAITTHLEDLLLAGLCRKGIAFFL